MLSSVCMARPHTHILLLLLTLGHCKQAREEKERSLSRDNFENRKKNETFFLYLCVLLQKIYVNICVCVCARGSENDFQLHK